MKLLHVDASILGDSSVSRQLSAAVVARLREAHPEAVVTYYDLGAEPIGHLTGAHLAAGKGLFAENASLQQDVARGQQALEDFLGADVVVSGRPCTTSRCRRSSRLGSIVWPLRARRSGTRRKAPRDWPAARK